MSLFENGQYHWRETYFVLFKEQDRPSAERVKEELGTLSSRFEFSNFAIDEDGQFESVTLISHHDSAAMDITYVSGEEVSDQVRQLGVDLKNATLTNEEMVKVAKLLKCDSRFDVYHFEEVAEDGDDILDPGALLIVLECLGNLCNGVSIDPQTGSVM